MDAVMITNRPKIKLTEWIKQNYEPGSEPSRNTIIARIQDGTIDGVQIGPKGKNGARGCAWYIYTDEITPENQEFADLLAEFKQEALNYG